MVEASIMFILSGLTLASVLYFGYKKASKLPENAGLEPGQLLVKSFVTYSMTYFIALQFIAMLSEAALLGAVQDADTNVSARMVAHVFMGLVGAVAAFALTKYVASFILALVTDRPIGVRIGLVATTFSLSAISLLLTVGSPLYNLMAMANSLQQTTELELYLVSARVYLGVLPQEALNYTLAVNGFPPTFAPYASLHSGMVTSLGITAFHLIITIWEILAALMVGLTNGTMLHALGSDFFDIKPENTGGGDTDKNKGKDPDKNKDKDKDKDKDKGKDDKTKAHDILIGICEALNVKNSEAFTDKLMPYFFSKDDDDSIKRISAAISLKSKIDAKKSPSAGELIGWRNEFDKLVNSWSKGALTLPKK